VWQAGFWTEAAPPLGLAPERVAAASAGAAMACVLFAGRFAHALAHFKAATGANRRNAYPANWLRGQPVFPHWAMYRHALLETIDAAALARLHGGPDIVVPITRKPAWLGTRSAFAIAGVADALEHARRAGIRRFAAPLGFGRLRARARLRDAGDACGSRARLVVHAAVHAAPRLRRAPGARRRHRRQRPIARWRRADARLLSRIAGFRRIRSPVRPPTCRSSWFTNPLAGRL
jgi:hypothetical protein